MFADKTIQYTVTSKYQKETNILARLLIRSLYHVCRHFLNFLKSSRIANLVKIFKTFDWMRISRYFQKLQRLLFPILKYAQYAIVMYIAHGINNVYIKIIQIILKSSKTNRTTPCCIVCIDFLFSITKHDPQTIQE